MDFDPDLVFCSRTKELTDQVRMIKRDLKAKICMWNVDTRYSIYEWKHLFLLIELCDYHFIVDTEMIPEWRRLNKNTFHLPQGVQNEVYKKPLVITDEDREKYSCDVSWAGSCTGSHVFRERFLMAVGHMGIDFKIWGCKGKPKLYDEEHNKMVALSKINLAMSGWPKNGKYTSVRNYKIMGAGGFVLEYYRQDLDDLFGSNVPWYKNPSELVSTIRFWLKEDVLRKDAAEKQYKWVHANATYTHRMQQALEIMRISE